jgi:hypothetical protein
MRQCIALAGLVCLLASGCTAGGFTAGRVATSQRAPRPTISRDFRKPGPEPAVQLAAYNAGCDTDCGCPVGGTCGADGCCSCGDPSCCNSICRRMVNGLAGGGCGNCGGNCGPGCCICPNGQSYPEYPAFNQGPPVGQVAYPYYTTHGPRDFLSAQPPNIGPY